MSDEEDRCTARSARMRHVCSAADDDEPEGVLLEILNARAVSSKKNSQTTGGKRAPTEHGYFTPRGEEKDIDTSQASVSVVTRLLNPTGEDRDENQSARMRRLCSATDDDEPEAMVLEMLNVRSSGNKSNLPIYRPNADVDLELVVESSLVEWDDESLPGPHSVHAATDVHLDFVDRGKFLYRSPVGAKSMHNMKTGPAEPVQRTLLKSSSMYDAKATPPRPRRHDDVTEPCSPGLLPSATKGAYSFSEERGEEKYNSEEELLEPEMDQSREFADVNSLFSKIRHNRLGFVASELEKGCDPSIRDASGNTMLHICAQNNLKKIAKICIQYNCDINAINNDGRTPLDICDKLQFRAMADWFIFMGAENGVLFEGNR